MKLLSVHLSHLGPSLLHLTFAVAHASHDIRSFCRSFCCVVCVCCVRRDGSEGNDGSRPCADGYGEKLVLGVVYILLLTLSAFQSDAHKVLVWKRA